MPSYLEIWLRKIRSGQTDKGFQEWLESTDYYKPEEESVDEESGDVEHQDAEV